MYGLKGLGRWSDWLLRLESDEFLMLVHKETNEYRNVYAKYMGRKEPLRHLVLLLDRHPNYED